MRSKKTLLSVIVNLAAATMLSSISFAGNSSRMAMPQQMSVGAFYGGPVGATATYMLSSDTLIDAAVAMQLGGDQNVLAWADYLWRFNNAFEIMDYQLGYYYGGGAKFRTENNPNIEEAYMAGPRGVAGIIYEIKSMSLEMFGEGAFTKHLLGGSKSEFDVAVGARYYF